MENFAGHKKIFKLFISIAICEIVGVIGSAFTFPSIPTWYAALEKPLFNPPNWIFAPVWTSLFALIGISLYLILEGGLENKRERTGLLIFGLQLVLNASWSFLFFGLHNIFYALLDIILLWFVILLTIHKFRGINRKAAYLLVPYLLWVSFAAVLNFYIWVLNP